MANDVAAVVILKRNKILDEKNTYKFDDIKKEVMNIYNGFDEYGEECSFSLFDTTDYNDEVYLDEDEEPIITDDEIIFVMHSPNYFPYEEFIYDFVEGNCIDSYVVFADKFAYKEYKNAKYGVHEDGDGNILFDDMALRKLWTGAFTAINDGNGKVSIKSYVPNNIDEACIMYWLGSNYGIHSNNKLDKEKYPFLCITTDYAPYGYEIDSYDDFFDWLKKK